jgi:hypothetical protein
MAITGTHTLLYTSEPEELRAMLRDVFGFKYVDTGHGWLIFGLPPSEIAVHPGEGPTWESGMRHQFTMMCDDLHATVLDLKSKGVAVLGDPQDEQWGTFVTLNLPGDCHVILYQPKHAVAAGM